MIKDLGLLSKINNKTEKVLFSKDFDVLYEIYRHEKNWSHKLMSDKYINIMSKALKEVHPLLNDDSFINDRNDNFPDWNWDNYYKELAWIGLLGIPKGKEHKQENDYTINSNLYIIDSKFGIVSSTKTPKCD